MSEANPNRNFLAAWLATLVVWFLGSFVVHHLLLGGDYRQVGHLFRAQADARPLFWLMIVAHALMAGAFVWIYRRGVEMARPWVGQGLRFGGAVALLGVVPASLMEYVVQPVPGSLIVKQATYGSVLALLLGLFVAFLHRAPARSEASQRQRGDRSTA